MKVFQTVTLGLALCLSVVAHAAPRDVVTNAGENEKEGVERFEKGDAEVVTELPQGEVAEEAAELTYSVELDYDAVTKNLVIDYKTVQLTSSICHYEAKNLEVSARTPTLVGPVAVGVISFDTDEVSADVCLTAFGHSGGSVTIDNFSGAPTALFIDGVSYGFLTLAKNGETVELVETLPGSSISQ